MSMYDQFQQKAFAGMKGDSRYDLVESYAAESAIPFGVVVTQGATMTKVKVGGGKPVGVALHSHAVVNGYETFDAVSVLRQGVAWCVVKDGESITAGSAVNFDPVSGKVAKTGTALPNATFKTDVVDAGKYGKLALVELA